MWAMALKLSAAADEKNNSGKMLQLLERFKKIIEEMNLVLFRYVLWSDATVAADFFFFVIHYLRRDCQ